MTSCFLQAWVGGFGLGRLVWNQQFCGVKWKYSNCSREEEREGGRERRERGGGKDGLPHSDIIQSSVQLQHR